ncbi:transposase [Ichthyobacterium seriolicida]|uniref:Transposase n=1 Tax=Ichthyobacterium seriolicida TaxID=242600 RepID=A0A1J1EAZ2_9FLAO|nr:transposase [Ichthyobacterium seriolicida]
MSFLKEIQRRGIEKILEGELGSHLDYSKYEQSNNTNFHNGYYTENVRASLGESKTKVPRDRDFSFNPNRIHQLDKIFL